MSLDTRIAGDPSAIEALADHLTSVVNGAIDEQVTRLDGPRYAYRELWRGPAGEDVADEAEERRRDSDRMKDAIATMARAIRRFSDDLYDIQSAMRSYCWRAKGVGLTVTGEVIQAPHLVPMTYPRDQPIPPDVAMKVQAHRNLSTAYAELEGEHSATIDDYIDACRRLTDAIVGEDDDSILFDLARGVTPASIETAGAVAGAFPGRMARSTDMSRLAHGLNGPAVTALVGNLVSSTARMDDPTVVRNLGDALEKGGRALDRYLAVADVLKDIEDGESVKQAVTSQGAGLIGGAVSSGLATAGAAAVFGAPTTPVGQAVFGAIGFGFGFAGGYFSQKAVDDWYDDQEFADLVEKGLREQRAGR